MKHIVIAFSALFAMAACTQDPAEADRVGDPAEQVDAMGGDEPVTGSSPAGTPAPGTAGETAMGEGDREALGLVGAINRHEIQAARQAQQKGVEGEVLAYAERMDREHSENQRKLEALGRVEQTDAVRKQEEKGRKERERLDGLSADAYADAYVEAMVKDHSEALSMLDDKLIPSASDPAARAHLEETRKHVAAHLEAARALQDGQ
ncbi:DUF4142 domain-containing protein [Luteimonas suaedae]|uniref:DUF4142 domain-containing protein n=1 Tax=Luteimonas suaedae TaxID=2605430 RepID=UPI0016591E82|nr:DUF4142 domain-containing protein [Luteimonas suaedae]